METLAVPSVPGTPSCDARPCILQPSVNFTGVRLATESYVTVLIDFSVAYRTFNKSLTPQVVIAAQALKKEFGVRQGWAGLKLKVRDVEMDWRGFVKKYFDISPSRFNQIVAIDDDPEPKAVKPPKKVVDRPVTAKTLTQQLAECDDEAELDEKFNQQEETIGELRAIADDLEAKLKAADEEKAALEAKIETMEDDFEEERQSIEESAMAGIATDWQDLAVEALAGKDSKFVQMELARLLDDLKLAGKLTVCDVE